MHVTLETVMLISKHNTYHSYFPSNTSHVLQSYDDIVFLNFKNYIRNNYRKELISMNKNKAIYLNFLRDIDNWK